MKSINESLKRYVESALISAVRLKRHWVSKGKSEEEVIEKATKQAFGMLKSSGASLETMSKLFDELDEATQVIKKVIDNAIKGISKKEADKAFIKCIACPHMLPMNLEWNDPVNPNAGGELRMQRKHLTHKRSRILIHNAFGAVGFLWNILKSLGEKVDVLLIFYLHLPDADLLPDDQDLITSITEIGR